MWTYVAIGVPAALVAFFIFGLWHMRRSAKQALREIEGVTPDEIGFLAEECVRTFKSKLGIDLSLGDLDGAAQALESAFANPGGLKRAFAKSDFYWYFVKPVGAFIGEFLREHAGHEWRYDTPGAPYMVCARDDRSSECYPFDKALKHVQVGGRGDLIAYLIGARTILDAVEGNREQGAAPAAYKPRR